MTKKSGKKSGRPKGSNGPLKRYLDYLWSAKSIESTLIVTHKDEDGNEIVDNRVEFVGFNKHETKTSFKMKSRYDIGHEILVELFRQALMDKNTQALKIILDRRYGKVQNPDDTDNEDKVGGLLKAFDEIVQESKKRNVE